MLKIAGLVISSMICQSTSSLSVGHYYSIAPYSADQEMENFKDTWRTQVYRWQHNPLRGISRTHIIKRELGGRIRLLNRGLTKTAEQRRASAHFSYGDNHPRIPFSNAELEARINFLTEMQQQLAGFWGIEI